MQKKKSVAEMFPPVSPPNTRNLADSSPLPPGKHMSHEVKSPQHRKNITESNSFPEKTAKASVSKSNSSLTSNQSLATKPVTCSNDYDLPSSNRENVSILKPTVKNESSMISSPPPATAVTSKKENSEDMEGDEDYDDDDYDDYEDEFEDQEDDKENKEPSSETKPDQKPIYDDVARSNDNGFGLNISTVEKSYPSQTSLKNNEDDVKDIAPTPPKVNPVEIYSSPLKLGGKDVAPKEEKYAEMEKLQHNELQPASLKENVKTTERKDKVGIDDDDFSLTNLGKQAMNEKLYLKL